MKCKKCKEQIDDDSKYCKYCGAPQKRDKKKAMYQRPDGLFEKIITIDGKRVAFRGKTESEVSRKMLEYQGKKEAGRTFGEIEEEWEDEHFPTLSPNTLRGYRPACKRAYEYFKDTHIKQITPNDINTFIGKQIKQGWAQKTAQTQLLVLNLIFSKAVVDGDVENNPVTYVRLPRNLPKKPRELPDDEYLDIIRSNVDKPFGLFPYFLLYTGCRMGEAQAIQFKDIDKVHKTITVNKSVYMVGNKPYVKPPKTDAGIRTIILLDKLAQVLPDGKPDDFLFSGNSEPLTQSQFVAKWNEYCKETGLAIYKKEPGKRGYYVSKVTPHQLRHAFATSLFEAGIDEKDAQELLGHANISVTKDIYTHIRKTRKQKTAELLNKFENDTQST